MKLRGAWLVFMLVVLAPKTALAEARWCTWTNETVASNALGAHLRCYEDAGCMDNAGCGLGRVCDETKCIPPCTTIRLAEDVGDCDGTSFLRLAGTAPAIVSVPSTTTFMPVGYCQSVAGPVCGMAPTWTEWERSYLHDETTTPIGAAMQHTNVWGAADSDTDHCQDGGDPNVCSGPEPTSCAALEAPATCGVGDGPIGTCCVGGMGFGCGSCPPADCSTIQTCHPDSDVWTCTPIEGTALNGACLRNDNDPVPIAGVTGVCLFPAFLRGCLMTGLPDMSDACFTSPTTGPTTNFFDGDCDLDGCPNGHDTEPCLRCDGQACLAEAMFEPRSRCRVPRPVAGEPVDPMDCLPDTGRIDAGPIDAGPIDAPLPASPDANVPEVTFGGGGGCVCTAGTRSPGHGLGLIALGLVAWIARRRAR